MKIKYYNYKYTTRLKKLSNDTTLYKNYAFNCNLNLNFLKPNENNFNFYNLIIIINK